MVIPSLKFNFLLNNLWFISYLLRFATTIMYRELRHCSNCTHYLPVYLIKLAATVLLVNAATKGAWWCNLGYGYTLYMYNPSISQELCTHFCCALFFGVYMIASNELIWFISTYLWLHHWHGSNHMFGKCQCSNHQWHGYNCLIPFCN